jgi:putative ABC transport system substrate-binding protein
MPGFELRRHQFITLLGGTAAAWPLAARGQQPAMPVVGFLISGTLTDRTDRMTAFRQGLKEAGFVEDQNVVIEYRSAEAQLDRIPALAAELARRQVVVIVAADSVSALAAKAATTTVPVVFVSGVDPVQLGLVASLNRPGGNVTGVSFISGELGAKRLGLLRELRPGATRIAVLVDPKWPLMEHFVSEVRAAASALGQQLIVLNVSSEREIESAFTTLVQRGAGALVSGIGGFFLSQRERIVALAARHRIPAIYGQREAVEAGGLMSYAPSIPDAYRQLGIYAGRILKGEKPGDLPVVLATKFELVINVNTAKALGIEVPPTLLATADEVIE